MLTVVYCTRETKPEHIEHIKKTSGLHKNIEVIEIINNGESLTKSYNRGLKQAKNDVVVFCHDDITIETKQWGKKLLKHYDKNPEYCILGVAGTKKLGESGRWWEDSNSMYGRVKHTHEGKTWMSKYSPDLGTNIEDVVLVDGVFFSIKKSKLKKDFDETVKGFHFYDVDFCFQNHLAGGKIGVHTNIVINHQSIGQTNDEWENNRKIFSEKYKDKLPVKILEEFKNRKMKVLLGVLNFKNLTGSEISTFELAKALVENGCDVSIYSQSGGVLTPKAKKLGIKVYDINNPPFYKVGDGRWGMRTPDGDVISEPGKLYQVGQHDFDIIQTNHKPITERLLQLYPDANFITIVRSEVIELEDPIVDDRIKKYIAIRPSIKDYLIEKFEIFGDKIDVIYNIFDKSKFKPSKTDKMENSKKIILFPGTMDYLRKNTIYDIVSEYCNDDSHELWLVGKDVMGYASELSEKNKNVIYFGETNKIESFYNQCDMTAGVMLGRTTIEGYLFNKPGLIYNIDGNGNIIDKEFTTVPNNMDIFNNKVNLNKYIKMYKWVYNHE